MALTAVSCACRMVSKLNVDPFQKVISPDEHPVSILRPSGVQVTTWTGDRILLAEAWTNLVGTEAIGSFCLKAGVMSCSRVRVGYIVIERCREREQ